MRFQNIVVHTQERFCIYCRKLEFKNELKQVANVFLYIWKVYTLIYLLYRPPTLPEYWQMMERDKQILTLNWCQKYWIYKLVECNSKSTKICVYRHLVNRSKIASNILIMCIVSKHAARFVI